MKEGSLRQRAEVRNGPDLIRWVGEKIIIYAGREMPEWQVREFSRPGIFFEGQLYYIRTREPAKKPYRVRYELWPWPEERKDPPSRLMTYDVATVVERERSSRENGIAEAESRMLAFLYPIIGLTSSAFKLQLRDRYGLCPRRATYWSFAGEFLVFLPFWIYWNFTGGFIVMVFGVGGSWSRGEATGLFLLLMTLVLDVVLRWDQLLRDSESPGGLLEWLWGPLRRAWRNRKGDSQRPPGG